MIPFRKEMEEMWNRAFDWEGDPFEGLTRVWERGGVPPLNFGESDNSYEISLELPGMDEKDIHIQIIGNQLVITGERKWESEKKAKDYTRVECQYGAFRRAITLPETARLDRDAIEAHYDKGMLDIRVPKYEPKPVVEIPVKVGKD
jgi:HSP20 family protein